MIRNLLITAGLLVMTASAAAQSNAPRFSQPANPRGGPLDLGPTKYIYEPPSAHPELYPFDERRAKQLVRWGEVGRCVVASDRETSLSYVAAKAGSSEATAAAKRLDPAFASCLSGSGVSAKNNTALRRAAIADALHMRLPA